MCFDVWHLLYLMMGGLISFLYKQYILVTKLWHLFQHVWSDDADAVQKLHPVQEFCSQKARAINDVLNKIHEILQEVSKCW